MKIVLKIKIFPTKLNFINLLLKIVLKAVKFKSSIKINLSMY